MTEHQQQDTKRESVTDISTERCPRRRPVTQDQQRDSKSGPGTEHQQRWCWYTTRDRTPAGWCWYTTRDRTPAELALQYDQWQNISAQIYSRCCYTTRDRSAKIKIMLMLYDPWQNIRREKDTAIRPVTAHQQRDFRYCYTTRNRTSVAGYDYTTRDRAPTEDLIQNPRLTDHWTSKSGGGRNRTAAPAEGGTNLRGHWDTQCKARWQWPSRSQHWPRLTRIRPLWLSAAAAELRNQEGGATFWTLAPVLQHLNDPLIPKTSIPECRMTGQRRKLGTGSPHFRGQTLPA